MGSLGIGELLLIGLVVLLVFGPNKLPEMMRNIGKAVNAFQQETQRAAGVLRDAIESDAPQTPTAPGIIDHPDEQPAGEATETTADIAEDEQPDDVPRAIRQTDDT